MRYVFPEINNAFETEGDEVNVIIIENTKLFFDIITDISNQVSGGDGRSVLSRENMVLRFDKNCELLDHFVPFSLNQKGLLSKIATMLEQRAKEGENYVKQEELLASVERFFYDISVDFSGDIEFDRLTMASLIKACDIRLCDDYDSLGEKIIDYMELVNEYMGEKMFITVGLRSLLSDNDTELFMRTVLQHGFHCLMIESHEKKKIPCERRYIIDDDMCEICQNTRKGPVILRSR